MDTDLPLKLQNRVIHSSHVDGGYIIDGVRVKGILKTLESKFYSNYRKVEKKRGITSSSKEEGIAFHRQVYHKYVCSKGGKVCDCLAKFKVRTRGSLRGSRIYRMLCQLDLFLEKKKWKVYDCEMVVHWPGTRYATAIDLVCVDNLTSPQCVYVLELKTGLFGNRNQSRTYDGSGTMLGTAGANILNSIANQHQLQLWFEVQALEKMLDIKVSECSVLYLSPIAIDGKYLEEKGAHWWFQCYSKRLELQKQLLKV